MSGRKIARLWPKPLTGLLIVHGGQVPQEQVLPDQAALPDPFVRVDPSRGHAAIHGPTQEWNVHDVQPIVVQVIVVQLMAVHLKVGQAAIAGPIVERATRGRQVLGAADRRDLASEPVAILALHRVVLRSR